MIRMVLDVEYGYVFMIKYKKMNVPIENWIIEECKNVKKTIWYTLLK